MNRLPDDRAVAAEPPLPEVVPENDNRGSRVRVLCAREGSSEEWLHAENRKEVGGDVLHDDFFRIAAARQVGPRIDERRHPVERRDAIAPSEELRRAEHVAFAWPVRALFPEHDDPLRIAERQPFEQHRVDDREDRGVGADAERERQDSDSREARRPQVQTDGVADVVEEGVH